jgi:hypothetical protein
MKNTTLASPAGALTTEQRGKAVQVVGAGTPFNDALMGKQLTEQYQLAVNGTAQVVRFGAMLMALRQHLLKSTRGLKLPRGSNSDGGVDAWLKEFAPEVKKATAYRFLHVAEAVAKDFQLPDKVSFIEIATSPASQLPENLQQKQSELWDFVNGTSQRSWLDRFVPAKPLDREKLTALVSKALPKTPEDVEAMRRAEVMEAFATVDRIIDHHDWHHLTDDQIRTGIDIFGRWVKEAKEYIAIPRSERVAAKLKKLAK